MGTNNITNHITNRAATNTAIASFAGLLLKLDYLSKEDTARVRQAYRFADEAHLGQMRKNGEPYITHPIAVAVQCTEWRLDAEALMAALLHDTLEDCGIPKTQLIELFGSPVAELVDGLTKLDKLHYTTREEIQAESFRKMLLAMARDVRVILIKLADRLHNMRTLADMGREKWGRIASETMNIYVPLAHRLGLNQTYRELQDLSFRHLFPWRSAIVSKAIDKMRGRRRNLIEKVSEEIETLFAQAQIPVRVVGRQKTLFSIYQKMDKKHLSFGQVTDMYGLRIILPSKNALDCYTALGVLHQRYKPIPEKFRDYIALPKPNGYQSLHTTLIGPSHVNVEFQVRTEAMHEVAESGIAAHWLYKANNAEDMPLDRLGSKWLQSLLDIQDETRDAAEFWENVKVDLFPDEVYVFSPKGQISSLPRGATVIDFAYTVHSNVGDHAVSAVVNNLVVPLRTLLKNGDVVKIEIDPNANPQREWLDFVRTGRARSRIRHYLKTMVHTESEAIGEKLLQQALRAEGIESFSLKETQKKEVWTKLLRFTGSKTRSELLIDIGLGKRIAGIIAKRIAVFLADSGHSPDAVLLSLERLAATQASAHTSIVLDGAEGGSVHFAPCCRPIPGDAIVGYLGHGEGVTVHRDECTTAKKLRHKDSERFINVEWSDEPVRAFEVRIDVTTRNGQGVLARITGTLATTEADILHMDMGQHTAQQQDVDLRFLVGVRDTHHLDVVLRALNRAGPVLHAKRHQA